MYEMYDVMILIGALAVTAMVVSLVIVRVARTLLSSLYGPISLAPRPDGRVEAILEWVFRFGFIWFIYLFFGIFFFTTGGNLANFVGQTLPADRLLALGLVGMITVAVARMLAVTYSGFMVQSFVFTIAATAFLVMVQFIRAPATLDHLTDFIIKGKDTGILQIVAAASLALAAAVEFALWVANRFRGLRAVPASLFSELRNTFQENSQYLHRSRTTGICIERIEERATVDGLLSIRWATISGDCAVLEAIEECEKKLPGKVEVKVITAEVDGTANGRICDCSLKKCEVRNLEPGETMHSRFMIINGREVVIGVSAPPRKHHGIKHGDSNPVDWANIAYTSTDLDTIANHTGIFNSLWSVIDDRLPKPVSPEE